MKTNFKNKNRVITRIENLSRRVDLCFAPIDSPYSFCLQEYSKKTRSVVFVKYFSNIRDAENFLFENYVLMIIPTNRFLNEGCHVFIY